MEGAVPPKGDLTRRNDCLFRSRLIAGDQKRELTQKMSFIPEAGHDFGWRCVVPGVDWRWAAVKPGHGFSSFFFASNRFSWNRMRN
jgi:hypothetical protein